MKSLHNELKNELLFNTRHSNLVMKPETPIRASHIKATVTPMVHHLDKMEALGNLITKMIDGHVVHADELTQAFDEAVDTSLVSYQGLLSMVEHYDTLFSKGYNERINLQRIINDKGFITSDEFYSLYEQFNTLKAIHHKAVIEANRKYKSMLNTATEKLTSRDERIKSLIDENLSLKQELELYRNE